MEITKTFIGMLRSKPARERCITSKIEVAHKKKLKLELLFKTLARCLRSSSAKNIGISVIGHVLQSSIASIPTHLGIRDVSTRRRRSASIVKAAGESRGQPVDWFPFGFIVCDGLTPKYPGMPSLAAGTTSRGTGRQPIPGLPGPVKTTGMVWTAAWKSGLRRRAEQCRAGSLCSVGLLGVNSARVTRMRYNTLAEVLVRSVPRG